MVKRRYILLISLSVHGLGLFALPNMCCLSHKTNNISVVFVAQKVKNLPQQALKINKESNRSVFKSEKPATNSNVFSENKQQSSHESPILISSVTPTYPDIAVKKGIEANFNAEITIDNYGNVVAVRVLENAYLTLFKSAIEQALYSWKFASGCKNKTFTVPIVFKLDV